LFALSYRLQGVGGFHKPIKKKKKKKNTHTKKPTPPKVTHTPPPPPQGQTPPKKILGKKPKKPKKKKKKKKSINSSMFAKGTMAGSYCIFESEYELNSSHHLERLYASALVKINDY